MVEITPQSNDSKEFTLPTPGTYIARLYQIVHNGTTNGPYGYQTQCTLRFELPTETNVFREENGPQPYAVSIPYIGVSFTEKSSLIKIFKSLGIDVTESFKLEDALGMACQITVGHKESSNGKTYLNAKAGDVAPLLKGTEVPEQSNKSRFFWIEGDYDIEWSDKLDDEGNPIPRRDANDKIILDSDGEQVNQSYKSNVSVSNVTFTNEDILMDWEVEQLRKSVERKAKNKAAVEIDPDNLPF